MTAEQFSALRMCVTAELLGDLEIGPEIHAAFPLYGMAKQLVELGFLCLEGNCHDVAGLTVTRAGYHAVAN